MMRAAIIASTVSLLSALLVACTPSSGQNEPQPHTTPHGAAAFGAFLGSDASGVERIDGFEEFLWGRQLTVGHTYLPGNNWSDIRGSGFILKPWTEWRAADAERTLVLNVPMLVPNEADIPDEEVATLLRRGADGEFDSNFRVLAERLVDNGSADTIIVLGWEMNGEVYTSRCSPNPDAWKEYWTRIVHTMRSVPGQHFRFDYTPSRGTDVIPWPECYPGDSVVDIIGMDSYDQSPGDDFDDYVEQPNGLRQQATFAAKHGKPISFPEWGLYRYGDRPEFIRRMHEWINTHDVVYHTIADYCPHGVWQCTDNPDSTRVFRELFGR